MNPLIRPALALTLLVAGGAADATNGYFAPWLRPQGEGHGRRGHRAGTRQLRRRQQPGQHGLGRRPASISALTGSAPTRDAERSGAGFPTLNGQRRQRQQELRHPRARLQPHDRQRPVGRRVGLRQRRPEYRLSAGQLQLRRRCRPTCCAASGRLGVDLMQLIVAPTVAYKLNPSSTRSVRRCCSATSASRPKACRPSTMRRAFRPSPARRAMSPTAVTTAPPAPALRARLAGPSSVESVRRSARRTRPRCGWAASTSTAACSRMQGDFDIPANYGVGVAIDAAAELDASRSTTPRIDYSKVAAVGNPSSAQAPLARRQRPRLRLARYRCHQARRRLPARARS